MKGKFWKGMLLGSILTAACINIMNWRSRKTGVPGWLSGPNSLFYNPEEPFYRSPEQMPEAPGELIRAQAAPHLLNLADHFAAYVGLPQPNLPAKAQRIVFSTRGDVNEPITSSAVVVDPIRRWRGPGPVPTLLLAPGTRGQGGVSAPSLGPGFIGVIDMKNHATGINYEQIKLYYAALRGMRVVQIDYAGSATDGVPRYVDPFSEAHTVLDAARATKKLCGLADDAPFAIYGYSQGGGAAAAAAEAAEDYAPDVKLVGTYAGAPVSDLLALVKTLDRTRMVGLVTYPLNSMRETDPQRWAMVEEILNEEGKRVVDSNRYAGVFETTRRHAWADTRSWTKSGKSLGWEFENHPEAQEYLSLRKLGKRKPNAPILIVSDVNDDVVPFYQAQELAQAYEEMGAEVDFRSRDYAAFHPGTGLTHILSAAYHFKEAFQWLEQRFRDHNSSTTKR